MPAPTYRQQDVTNPHFRLPFSFGGINGGAFMNEQDSSEDVVDCIKSIIAFPIGSRQELPDFGIPDVVFQMRVGEIPMQIKTAIALWEDRPAIDVEGAPLVGDEMIFKVLVEAGITGG